MSTTGEDFWSQFKRVEESAKEAPQQAKSQPDQDFWGQFKRVEPQKPESIAKSAGRLAAQPVIGAADITGPGILTNAWNLLGSAEALDELRSWKEGREAELRQKFPTAPWPEEPVFDEQKYLEALQNASKLVPTPSNIASFLEEQTGLPLEAKTKLQRYLRTAGSAAKMVSGAPLVRAQAGVIAPAAQAGLEAAGVPEALAEPLALGTAAVTPKVSSVEAITKPSGMPERRFEALKSKRVVTPEQAKSVREAVTQDVKDATERLLTKKSQVRRAMTEDPIGFVEDLDKDFEAVQNLVEDLPVEEVDAGTLLQSIRRQKQLKDSRGITRSEAEKSYDRQMKSVVKELGKAEEVSPTTLLEQFRKNNKELRKFYQPGASQGANEGVKDALLDYNRAIADVFESKFPESEFNKLFKASNETFSEVSRLKAIDEFMDKVFQDGKINFTEVEKLPKRESLKRDLIKTIGKDGYRDFVQIMKELKSTQRAMKLLSESASPSISDFFKEALKFITYKPWGLVSAGIKGVNFVRNSLLANKKYRVELGSTLKDLKRGRFAAAQQGIKSLEAMQEKAVEEQKNEGYK